MIKSRRKWLITAVYGGGMRFIDGTDNKTAKGTCGIAKVSDA